MLTSSGTVLESGLSPAATRGTVEASAVPRPAVGWLGPASQPATSDLVAKNLGDWLAWLTRVRFLLITMLMGLVVILQE